MTETEPILISVCVLAKNCEAKIGRCLQALAAFDDVCVLDTGSTDRTLEIAASFPNVRIFHQDGIDNFGITRNSITEKTTHDWVLHIDSDEFVTPKFLDEIRRLNLEPNTVYSICLRMVYRGHPLPPFDTRTLRLYHRRTTAWSTRAVHETIDVRSEITPLPIRTSIEHHSYDSVDQLIHKAQYYSTLFAEQFHTVKKTSFWNPYFHGIAAFLKFYIFRGAFLYGYRGYLVSRCLAFGSFLKYAKLIEFEENAKQ